MTVAALDSDAATWWRDWWSDDFSWNGLARMKWPGWSVSADNRVVETNSGALMCQGADAESLPIDRPATLQDYWRMDLSTGRVRPDPELSDELVVRPGQPTFHRVHLPMHYRDGAPTGKLEWPPEALDPLLAARLDIGAETPGAYRFKRGPSGWYSLGPDRRTQLVGAVLLRASLSSQEVTHLNARRSAIYANAIYDAARFGRGTEFAAAYFSGEARFHRATFEGDVRFTSAVFCGAVDFEGAVFAGEASFFRARFLDDASFRSGQFQDTVWFTAARLANVEFRAREFLGIAYFDSAMFTGQFDFVCASFGRLASFERIVWPSASRDWHAAFDHAIFRSPVSFRHSRFKALASFAGAVFERGVQIDHADERAANTVFREELSGIWTAAAADANDDFEIEARRAHVSTSNISAANFMAHTEGQARWIDLATLRDATPDLKIPTPTIDALEIRRAEFREVRLKELEAGCRTLKQAMAMGSDTAREQVLYRFELIARRAQRATSFSEKMLSVIYGIVSDYGSSIVLPVISWIASIVLFALGFWGWSMALMTSRRVVDEDFAQALDFSWRNAARPFSALTDEAAKQNEAVALIFSGGQWGAFAARVLGTVESMISIGLIFLFALAIRRRFQMN